MKTDRSRRIERIFFEALDQPPAELERFLEHACHGDPALRARVRALLDSDRSDATLLDTPACDFEAVAADRTARRQLPAGAVIGGFAVRRLLGAGGMGSVYEADQENPRRAVALKVLSGAQPSAHGLRRFQYEADLLARLRHPNIAQIHAAGVHEEGVLFTPYFAMELVEAAAPLTDYAARARLDIRARLRLFIGVCAAVEHGHQKGIVHRDLKPSNVLVDAGGVVKVIDYGVARLVEEDGVATRTGGPGDLLGTVPYMSPEQAAGRHDEVDTRTDVYALGVVLYELLTGQLPYASRGAPLGAALRAIQETPPAPAARWNRALRGDLETILARALEKSPARRYASAGQLAADIRRHLDNEPIEARPASAWYKLRKLAARHQGLAAGALVALAGLALGVGVATWQAVEATRDRDRALLAEADAEREARISAEIATFLRDMLRRAQPGPDGEVTVREVLDDAALTIATLRDSPEVRAELHDALGQAYFALGRFDEAEREYDLALALRLDLFGPDDPRTLNTRNNLTVLYADQGRWTLATDLQEEVLAAQRRVLGSDHSDTIQSMLNLAANCVYLSDYARAETLTREALDRAAATLPPDSPEQLAGINTLAVIYGRQGRIDQAAPLLRSFMDASERVHGPDHPTTLTALNNLARAEEKLGHLDSAEALLRDAAARRAAVLTPEHPQTLTTRCNLAALLKLAGKLDEAETILLDVLAIQRARDPGHPETLSTERHLASLYRETDRVPAAATLLAQIVASARTTLPAGHPTLGIYLNDYGDCLLRLEDYARAEPVLLEALALLRATLGDEHPRVAFTARLLVRLYEQTDRPDEADRYRELAGD